MWSVAWIRNRSGVLYHGVLYEFTEGILYSSWVCRRQNTVWPSGRILFWTFYCLPLSSFCKTTHRHWIHIDVCRVYCGGVYNMLLVLSITLYFHKNIRGCMCSIGSFQYRWLKGYIYSSCYYHHQIGSIHLSHCYHIFPWLCAWDVCYIIFCHLLHIRSGKKTGICFHYYCAVYDERK